jgi:tRNA pseudouridine synthase 10
MENETRGMAIKALLTARGHRQVASKIKTGIDLLESLAVNGSFEVARIILSSFKVPVQAGKACLLCENRFATLDELAEKVAREIRNYEFATFLIGVELPLEVEEREDEFRARFRVTHGESMRSAFSRNFGKRICSVTRAEVNHGKPDIVVLVNPFAGSVKLQANPLYVAGKYKKLVRGIPQSTWRCGLCDGEGCPSCNWTGRRFSESVEEIVGSPILKAACGKETAFHGSGREDVDVRMLGSGRPFVLEIKEPRKRFINLEVLEHRINETAKGRVEVHHLFFANRAIVRQLKKSESSGKLYQATVEFRHNVSDSELELLRNALSSTVVYQRTPTRVLHRRADLTREKYIYETLVKRLARNRAEMKIRCQGGLYIKELITGDDGRTNPSVTGILENKATPLELDVLNVDVEGKNEVKRISP